MRDKRANTIPQNLKHKPLFEINSYGQIDGFYKNSTDVVGLSVGKAQWRENENFVPSVKVWRDVKVSEDKYKWSRQSEETTLTRAVDMAMLAIRVYDGIIHNKPITGSVANTLFGDVTISKVENEYLLKELQNYFSKEENRKDMEAHIVLLKKVISECE